MKPVKKSLLLLPIASLLLTSCSMEQRLFCLDTYNNLTYQAGYCMELSRKDVKEVFYVYCLPNNPEASASEYQYELTWNKKLNLSYFSFVNGLEGKKIDSVVGLENNTLIINVHGLVSDQEATHGYLKINPEAFTTTDNSKSHSYAYAYFSIGNNSGVSLKPEDVSF